MTAADSLPRRRLCASALLWTAAAAPAACAQGGDKLDASATRRREDKTPVDNWVVAGAPR